MNRRDNDDLTHIPEMTPAQDELVNRRSSQSHAAKNHHGAVSKNTSESGSNLLTIVSVIFAIAALGASYFLWDQSRLAQKTASNAERRLASLEAQLTSTGDELSQSDAAVRVKLKELDDEVRKLWDSRKKANTLSVEQSKTIKNLTTRTASTRKKAESLNANFTSLSAELDEIVELVENANIESVAAKVKLISNKTQKLDTEFENLKKRVKENEEWVESINAFRKQVNQKLAPAAGTSSQPVLQ